ncbi:MAG TPA: hypothetical protein VF622_14525 [Segetibacter sp.]
MKASIFTLFFLLLSCSVFAQLDNIYKNKSITEWKNKPGIKFDLNHYTPPPFKLTIPEKNINQMGVLKLESKGIYKGNNGKGSDFYVYEPDNMPCLKPDSTFHSNMPVVGLVVKPKFKP